MKSKRIAFAGITAAAYCVITVAAAPLSYGAVQFRFAEALMIFCMFSSSAVWGLTVGCFIANLFTTVGIPDLVFGTFATLGAGLALTKIKNPWIAPVPVILMNGILVGLELALFTDSGAFLTAFGLGVLSVGAGEAAVMYLLGIPLYYLLTKTGVADSIRKL